MTLVYSCFIFNRRDSNYRVVSYNVEVQPLDGVTIPVLSSLPHESQGSSSDAFGWYPISMEGDLARSSGYRHAKSGLIDGGFHASFEIRVIIPPQNASARFALALDATAKQGAGSAAASDPHERSQSIWVGSDTSNSALKRALEGLQGVSEARVESYDWKERVAGAVLASSRSWRVTLAFDEDWGAGGQGPVGSGDVSLDAPQLRLARTEGFAAVAGGPPPVLVRRLRAAALPADAAAHLGVARLLCGAGGVTSYVDARLARRATGNSSGVLVGHLPPDSHTHSTQSMDDECLLAVPVPVLASGARHLFRVRARVVGLPGSIVR